MRRISFSQQDAEHVYEWLIGYWEGKPFGGCFRCEQLGKRLEACIGKRATRTIRSLSYVRNKEDPS